MNQAVYPIRQMCRLLGLSTSGYYAHRQRPPSQRSREDAALRERIAHIHQRSYATYGAPRVHAELRDTGVTVGKKRVARLMREMGLRGVSRRRSVRTTVRAPAHSPGADLVQRQFAAEDMNQLWVAERLASGHITYVPSWAGFIYLAVVLDACSRRIVGWAIDESLHTQLVLDALDMALTQRRPSAVIHHSDYGSQYTSINFGQRCKDAGVRPSMGSVGDAYDNAMAESFFASLECELLARNRFKSKTEARMAIFTYIQGWYNPQRRHSALGYQSPINFERNLMKQTAIS